MECHELEVVLMRSDTEMCDTGQGLRLDEAIGDEEFSSGIVIAHFESGVEFGKTGGRHGLADSSAFLVGNIKGDPVGEFGEPGL